MIHWFCMQLISIGKGYWKLFESISSRRDPRPLNIICAHCCYCRQYKSIARFLFFLYVNDQINLFLEEWWMIAETLWTHARHFGLMLCMFLVACIGHTSPKTCITGRNLFLGTTKLCLGTAPRHILDKPKGNEWKKEADKYFCIACNNNYLQI
jgi:hypothetical protein